MGQSKYWHDNIGGIFNLFLLLFIYSCFLPRIRAVLKTTHQALYSKADVSLSIE